MNDKQICESLIGFVKEIAADAEVTAVISETGDKTINVMAGNPQFFENSTIKKVVLTVMINQQVGGAFSEDLSTEALRTLATETVAMALAAPANKDAIIATDGEYMTDATARAETLDLFDTTTNLDVAKMQEMAITMENAALAVAGVTKCSTSRVAFKFSHTTIVTSAGFEVSTSDTCYMAVVSVIAGDGDTQTEHYSYDSKRHLADLEDMAAIGKKAGEGAVAKQGAVQIPSGNMPVVFDHTIAPQLLTMFAEAINGMAVAKGETFLKDSIFQPVFAEGITIVDDPTIPRGLGSTPCDKQGVESEPLTLVSDGILQSWLLGLASAKRLGLTSNGRSGGTTNLHMQAGNTSRDELIAGIEYGVLITDMLGHSSTLSTGDFSRGASGFLIENGKVTTPVDEITIAGNLKDMFLNMLAANDLKMDGDVNAPTVKVASMAVAGS